jgi:tetratricopeptide (TPR) repeat protein
VAVPAAEIQARDEFTAACKRLAAGDWNAAALAARRSLKAADLPEAHLALALAEAGLDHADGVDRELDAFVAHGFALRYPLDIAGLQGASSGAQRMLRSSGAGQEAGALQLVVQAHLLRPWRQDELVIRYMDHAQRLAPGLAAVFGLRAAADLRLGHVEQAEDSLEEALRLQPGRPQTYFTLVSLDREHEHWADALAHLDLAVDNGGSALLADCHRACISADQGHWDEAERFLAGCGANARHVIVFEAAMEVAEDASRAGQSERAERIVRGLLAADPTALGAWDLLALTLLRAGHPQQALDAVQRIHEQYPDDAVTAAIAALVLAHLDRTAEAAAVMATLPPPTNDALGLQFRSYRALYAAAIGDQALMTQDLTAVLGGARHQRVLHWMAEDPLFAAYRAEAWFNDLPTATGAASATVAAPASDHGAEPKK